MKTPLFYKAWNTIVTSMLRTCKTWNTC